MHISSFNRKATAGNILYVFVFLLISASFCFAQEKSAAGLYNEGFALLKSKDYIGGLALMEQALAKAAPEDEKVIGLAKKNGSKAAYNAANKLRKEGSVDEALALYNKGIELDPANSSNYEGIARSYEAKKETLAAVQAYMTAAAKGAEEGKDKKAKSRQKKARTMVGKLYVAKSYEEAIASGEAFIAVKNDDSEVHYYVSRCYAEMEKNEKALEHASLAVNLAGEAAPDKYYYAQATQFEKLGKTSDAIATYKKITGDKYKAQAEYKISELGG